MAETSFNKAAKLLESEGYYVRLDSDGVEAWTGLSKHLLSIGWVKIRKVKGKTVIFYGTKATLLAWVMGIPFTTLIMVIRALTLDNINYRTFNDANRALYGEVSEF